MQYVLLPASNDQYFLADQKEVIAIKEGVIDAPDFDESNLTYRLVYGAYKPQPHAHYTDEEIRAHMTEAIDQWLIHINGRKVVNLSIEGIVISESVIKRQSTELQHPRATQDVAFAALVKAPESFEIDDKHYQTRTAYLRWDGIDAIATLLNRKGLFAFTSEDKRFTPEEPLTKKNWQNYIDHLRMLKEARRAQ
ncbi:hypothetical protein MW344_003840 [Vibrio parahaemolyticus]|uniref:hypothetical protein n=1 Tax=Vibrio parahaemolyticus TaxID=670 RepID=UPI001B819C67|nr:hypothetical protein [Vibrio parahaemolyticus]EGQ8549693.1 hypothetical protein [Vibrio parahaemolyticus]EGQ9074425.1 hypothetical protein [Vibrio parahaemolyticus]EGQ9130548.1 hypothetical protein [Vibrio parahaemolyticus]EIO3217275.1 hypothetical protein [Vibrio parahaemolyticus]EJB8439244.1 hypothetical protein [Vibrio parahaemolyticus]